MAFQTLTDADGFTWDVMDNDPTYGANVVNGSIDAFDHGFQLSVDGTVFSGSFGVSELGGRQLVINGLIGGVSVARRVYVPNGGNEGWARFLESFTNTTASALTISVTIRSNSGNDGGMQILQTSSGDTSFTTADRWVINDDNGGAAGGDPTVAHIFTDGRLAPTSVSTTVFANFGTEGIAYTFTLTIAPGQTVSLLHFGSQQHTLAEMNSELATLADPDSAALYGLTPDQRQSVANFDLSLAVQTGTAGNDLLFGGSGDDQLNGLAGDDGLRGFDGNDELYGGDGNDFLAGGEGSDYLDGGTGFDRVSHYSGATAGVTVDLGLQGVAQNTGQGWDILVNIEAVSGTSFNDTLTGDNNNNWLWGSAATLGDGSISAANNDILDGKGGNDLLTVGIGTHTIIGGTGTDTLSFGENGAAEPGITVDLTLQGTSQITGAGSWTISGIENLSGGIGNDTLIGDSNANVLAGNTGNDTLRGGDGNDTLYGDGMIWADTRPTGGSGPITTVSDATSIDPGAVAGNDVLEGGLGNDILDGGGGSDTASYANASGGVQAFLYNGTFGEADGADGYDELYNMENLRGSAFNDLLVGNNAANILWGGAGQDSLRGNGGNDQLFAEDGNDFLNGGFGDDIVDGGAGFDRAAYFQTNPALGGITVSLQLQGTAQNTGSQGFDTLSNIEHVSGTPFADTITGDANDNWLWGSGAVISPGNVSATNNDTIDGADGNDLIVVGYGNHLLMGGTGSDTLAFSENADPARGIRLDLSLQGAAQDTTQGNWNISGFENLTGSFSNDELTGDGGANVLAGHVGNDTLVGGGGNDSLYGDGFLAPDTRPTGGSGPITLFADAVDNHPDYVDGDDLLEGGLGNDLINGGGGIDTASYANASGGVTVDLGSGSASGADGNDTLVSIENVIGSEFDDDLTGGGGANVLEGRGGNDFLAGGAGDDTLLGGDGDDFLQGDFGENNIGVTGNDILDGGNGNDLLRGGLGNDQLLGGANNDLLRGNGGVDYFDGGADDGEGVNGIGDRVSFYERRATQGAIADLRTGIISNDGFGNVETMVGIESLGSNTAFADTFYGNDGRNFLFGDATDSLYGFGGDDIFQSSSAAAIVDGGSGRDRLIVTTDGGSLLADSNGDGLAEQQAAATAGWTVNLTAGTTIDGYGGTGTVTGIEDVDGSALNDTLIGDSNANVLNGGDGNDTLNGRGGHDTLDGGNGIDTASYANASGDVQVTLTATGGSSSGADGNDTLFSIENVMGSAFNDSLTGNAGDNRLEGGGGHDFLYGRLGNDVLLGGAGDDFLRGEDGDDVLDGGSGNDRVSYAFLAGAGSGVTVNLNLQGAQQNTGHGLDTLIGIEHVSGTIYNDVLTGDGNANWLWGGSNGSGVTGNDTISGGAGNDLIAVGAGTHTLDGGTGNDTLSLYGNGTDISVAGITYDLSRQGIAQNTEQGMMMTQGFENVSGSKYDDFITGDGNANILLGDAGNDTIRGEDGNDTIYGDGRMAVDTHGLGGSGAIGVVNDVAATFGAVAGNDILLGGRGDDFLYGGRGNDVLTGNQGIDRFVIESQSGNDRVTDYADGIDKIVFDSSSGVDAFSDLVITKVGNDTVISWGTSDSIRLEGIKSSLIGASDFEFVGGPVVAAFGAGLADGGFAHAGTEAANGNFIA